MLKSLSVIESESQHPQIASVSRGNDGTMNISPIKYRENVDISVFLFVLIQHSVQSKYGRVQRVRPAVCLET
jgi:hypothetical protein